MANLYQKFFNPYRDNFSSKFSEQEIHKQTKSVWKALQKDKGVFPANAELNISELQQEKNEEKGSLS